MDSEVFVFWISDKNIQHESWILTDIYDENIQDTTERC
jgi:hypothetical protein